jgi:uncharacterized protein YggE
MSRGSLVVAAAVAALTVSAPASADQSRSVTATGAAQEKVTPKHRKSNASINAAVDKARAKGIAGAMAEAHEYALKYARAAGLKLGAIISVSDAQSNNGFGYYGGPGFFGPFGPNQFCGTVSQPVIKVVGGKRKRVGSKRVHRCFVPPFETTTLTVTYSAS